jgi:hypothetical protein
MDYAPDTTEDPSFQGLVVDCEQVCDAHGIKLRRCWHFKEWTRAEASTCDPLKMSILDHCCPRTISNCVFVLNHLCTVKFRENFRIHDAKKIPMDALDTLRNTGIHAFVSPKCGERAFP